MQGNLHVRFGGGATVPCAQAGSRALPYTETSDWREGRGSVAESVLFGPRSQEKVRAFKAALELTTGASMN